MEYLLLLLGFTVLIFSGRLLITSSVAIARRLRMPSFVIGLTVVAIGTSAPELLVSLTGALKGHPDLAVYNIVGSNISNLLLVLALGAIILPIQIKSLSTWLDGACMIGFSVVVWLILLDLRFSAREGVLVFTLLIIYLSVLIFRSRKQRDGGEKYPDPGMHTWLALVLVPVSSGGLALGADLLVDNAVNIALQFGLSQRIISVSMIAVGTSIPELTTSAIAAFRKETDIAIGNIIGSNLFNIGFVLGLTTMIKPLEVNPLILSFDVYWFVGAGMLLMALILLPRRSLLSRWKGLVLLAVYLVYLYLILK